jgi:hypothetical protein
MEAHSVSLGDIQELQTGDSCRYLRDIFKSNFLVSCEGLRPRSEKKNAEISSARRRIICLLELEVNNAIR